MKRPFLIPLVLGGLTLAIFLILLASPIHPAALPEGFMTPALALQYARTETDLLAFFGGATMQRANIIAEVDTGLWLDTFFIAAYVAFLANWFWALWKTGTRPWILAGLALAVMGGVCDILENAAINAILADMVNGGTGRDGLDNLALWSGAKWRLLAGASAVAGLWFAFSAKPLHAVLCLIPFAAAAIAGVSEGAARGTAVEAMALGIMLSWLVILWSAWQWRERGV